MTVLGDAQIIEQSVASASTCDLAATHALKVAITGTTGITSFGTGLNLLRFLRFTAALTLSYNATSMVLPGGRDLFTAAGDTAVATSDGSGNWTIRHYTRAAAGHLAATATNDDAAAGEVGEFLTASGSSIALSTGGVVNIASLSLGPGDWLAWGSVAFGNAGSSIYSSISAGVNSVTATMANAQQLQATFAAGNAPILASVPARFKLSTTTTIFLVAGATWTTGTPTAGGTINATRRR